MSCWKTAETVPEVAALPNTPLKRLCENPNREVGDASVQPTRSAAASPGIPQPAGWGSFTSACFSRIPNLQAVGFTSPSAFRCRLK